MAAGCLGGARVIARLGSDGFGCPRGTLADVNTEQVEAAPAVPVDAPAVDIRCARCSRRHPTAPLMGQVLDGLTNVYTLTRVGDLEPSRYSKAIHGPRMESTEPVASCDADGTHIPVLRRGGQLRCRSCRWTPRISHADVLSEAKIAVRDAGARSPAIYV